jgi:hypothetical protein
MAPRGAPPAERTERRISEPLSWSRWRVPTPGIFTMTARANISTLSMAYCPQATDIRIGCGFCCSALNLGSNRG